MHTKQSARPKATAIRRQHRPVKCDSAPQVCSVSLIDIADVASSKYTTVLQDIEALSSKLTSLGQLVSKLTPLAYLFDTTLQSSRPNMHNVGTFIDSVATEVASRIKNAKNAIVFNVPDRIPLTVVKSVILRAGSMENVPPCEHKRGKNGSR